MTWVYLGARVLSIHLVHKQVRKRIKRKGLERTASVPLPDPDICPATSGKINGRSIRSHEIDGVKSGPKTTEAHGILV